MENETDPVMAVKGSDCYCSNNVFKTLKNTVFIIEHLVFKCYLSVYNDITCTLTTATIKTLFMHSCFSFKEIKCILLPCH